MDEYLGVYDEEWIELHVVKIMAESRQEADDKFEEYLKEKLKSVFIENKAYLISLFGIEII